MILFSRLSIQDVYWTPQQYGHQKSRIAQVKRSILISCLCRWEGFFNSLNYFLFFLVFELVAKSMVLANFCIFVVENNGGNKISLKCIVSYFL